MSERDGSHRADVATASAAIIELAQQLVAWFDTDVEYAVALSGGVDSAVVAKAASEAGARATAVTARSPSVAAQELADVERLLPALQVGHRYLSTEEVLDPRYQRNDERRCYYCKSQLFETIARTFPEATILTGTNFDDLSDYRPGLVAAQESAVRAPLSELGIRKREVRLLADHWGLHVADKPASPCLASRIAHGVAVTPERLRMVQLAENLLRGWELTEFRVRVHADDLARIEVPASAIEFLAQPKRRDALVRGLKQLGFRFVCLDLQGFRSGSLNPVFQIESIT